MTLPVKGLHLSDTKNWPARDIRLSDRERRLSATVACLSDREICLSTTDICLSDCEICRSATDIRLSDREIRLPTGEI